MVEQPLKIPFLAAIVLAANPQSSQIAHEIIARSGTVMQEYLDVGAWREVKLVLRFLGCLQELLEEDGVFSILEELFSRAVDLQTASSEDVWIGFFNLTVQANRGHCRAWDWNLSRSFS